MHPRFCIPSQHLLRSTSTAPASRLSTSTCARVIVPACRARRIVDSAAVVTHATGPVRALQIFPYQMTYRTPVFAAVWISSLRTRSPFARAARLLSAVPTHEDIAGFALGVITRWIPGVRIPARHARILQCDSCSLHPRCCPRRQETAGASRIRNAWTSAGQCPAIGRPSMSPPPH